ncbi:MAG: hypothetical protein ABI432_09030 [Flavobacteriales bacterium]
MSNKETKTAGRPSAEQLTEWKAQHKNLCELTTEDGKVAICRTPNIVDLEMALDKSKKPNAKSLDFNRTIFARCVLYQDEGLMDDDGRRLEILTAAGQLGEIKEASVKKL